jgi:nicotinamide-nucleotide amidase
MLPPATLDLARAVVERAVATRRTLATAESLTGGLLGAAITSVAGASEVYRGGLIAYATDLKATLAGVDPAVLSRDGAVAATTAEALARGAAQTCGAALGLGLTGVAGPTEQEGHPAGTVLLGWYAGSTGGHRLIRLTGDRDTIRSGAVAAALETALALLSEPERWDSQRGE